MPILTLAQYKKVKDITVNTYDSSLTEIINAVNAFIIAYCNRSFERTTYTEKKQGVFDNEGQYIFHVDNSPIISVTSVSVKFFGVVAPLTIDVTRLDIFEEEGYMYYAYVFDPSIGVIRSEYRDNFYYTIVYVGGYATTPPPITLAATHMVSDNFVYLYGDDIASGIKTKTGGLRSIKIGDYSESYNANTFGQIYDKGTGLIVTPTIKDLLAPYINHGQSW